MPDKYWVHCENEGGGQKWFGPFDDLDSAFQEAKCHNNDLNTDKWDCAEIILGTRGQTGRHIGEYYLGRQTEFGASRWGWPQNPVIPENAGR